MAEAWTRHLKPDLYEPFSAGIEKHGLNRVAERVMLEAGVDISQQQSKTLESLRHMRFNYVVTVCSNADATCPTFSGPAIVVHVPFDDPPALAREAKTDDDALDIYRRVRDEIRDFVEGLPATLVPVTRE